MRFYIYSLGAGLLVGILYSIVQVRSPAPPMVALVGLFGILVGEQVLPLVRQLASGCSLAAAWAREECGSHVFGVLPGNASAWSDTDEKVGPAQDGS